MCRAMAQEGRFVPELCPLLQGLPPEEAARAMVDNPHIRACVEAFSGGPHVFNLGHGITPDAAPANVERMLAAIRG